MSDIIRQLPDSVANQIAAGEVVQRPASVIKELVENAIDAGATEIKIVVKDAGKTMIQVSDNGIGMSPTDARMAFERHATSKIRQAEDLFKLHTMGFRGEALPSICAISEVDLKTKTKDSKLGTHLVISGSNVILQEPCMCENGTVLTIKKLFFNVPARRKFLKSDNVELTNIIREFERMALVNNHVRFHLDTGSKVLDLRPGSMKQRIIELWQSSLDSQLIPISVETSIVKIEGFISRPEYARRRNALQFLIGNGRNMKHQPFRKTILSCYDTLIAADTQPCFFLKLEVDPDSIDVNISPTKDDIKFEYEQEIRAILSASIKAALGKFSAVPSIDFTSDAIPVKPLREGEIPTEPQIKMSSSYNPFKNPNHSSPIPVSNWEALYSNFTEANKGRSDSELPEIGLTEVKNVEEREIFKNDDRIEVAPTCIQFALKYIVMPAREGLMLIDQHRAHVKVLYEEYMKNIGNTTVVSQNILFPEKITLDENQIVALEEINEDLKRLGFSLEYDSNQDWIITSVPSMFRNQNIPETVLGILDSVVEDSLKYGNREDFKDDVLSRSALMLARSEAVRRGTKLSVAEMESLTCKLFELKDPYLTPNGNKIISIIDEAELAGRFE